MERFKATCKTIVEGFAARVRLPAHAARITKRLWRKKMLSGTRCLAQNIYYIIRNGGRSYDLPPFFIRHSKQLKVFVHLFQKVGVWGTF